MFKNVSQLFIIVIILVSAIPSLAQHKIKGRVINEDGEPLVLAHVVMLNLLTI